MSSAKHGVPQGQHGALLGGQLAVGYARGFFVQARAVLQDAQLTLSPLRLTGAW